MYGVTGSNFRLSGLASGLDTDKMVSDLMKVERMPIDKLEQRKQITEWKQSDYRDITNLLRSVKDEYFDILKSDTYMLTERAFKSFDVKSTNSDYVTATGLTSASSGTHSVQVNQLATADIARSSTAITKVLSARPASAAVDLTGKTINIELDGVLREIELENYTDLSDMKDKLQTKIDEAFGENKITVGEDGENLSFEPKAGSGTSKITLYSGSTEASDGLNKLGFSPGVSNHISIKDTLEDLSSKLNTGMFFDSKGQVVFSINDEKFSFSKDDTIQKVMNEINNNSDAKVNINYDEVTDEIRITAKQLGTGDNIRLETLGGNFFEAIGINADDPVELADQGQDAKVYIDNQLVTRSSNNFDVNGIRYEIHKEHDETNADDVITIEQDVDAVYDKIKGFIDKYNEVLDKINSKLSEEYDRSYLPLTQEEKESMSDDDIKRWEERAKTGLLRNDSILQNIVYDMREALVSSVEGVGISLSSIGISSSSYKDKGKLSIDETKLKEAIRNKPDEVMNLLIKDSSTVPTYGRDLSAEERSTRYQEEGLLYRISDIMEDNITSFRDKNGRKGTLLEKAGMIGDASEFTNTLYNEISDYEVDIAELIDKLYIKEENYYKQFSQLETYMQQMNNQANWLTSQLGTGQ